VRVDLSCNLNPISSPEPHSPSAAAPLDRAALSLHMKLAFRITAEGTLLLLGPLDYEWRR
jgi:hypothetical protein